MATYNGAKYLSEQLDSILVQTIPVDEIIIVDDCSTDHTWAILSNYVARYAKIKIYRNELNLGVVKTFESALTLCSGEFIALSDQDDVWLPDKLEILRQNLKEDNDLVHSDAYLCDEALNVYALYSDVKGLHLNPNRFIDYLNINDVSGCTALFTKSLLDKILPIPDGFWMHDHYIAIMARYYGNIIYVDKPLIKYRQHSSNSLGSKANLSYKKRKAWELNLADSLNLLKSLPEFKDNQDIAFASKYHMIQYSGSIPDLSTLVWCFKWFGLVQTLKLMFSFLGNSKILNKLFYKLRALFKGQ